MKVLPDKIIIKVINLVLFQVKQLGKLLFTYPEIQDNTIKLQTNFKNKR